ncbi:MAG: MazG family protein [Acidobacteriota bacterium]|nr:MazG family protein [Acidobacteriota bacterium]
MGARRPKVVVVGLGPAGAELVPEAGRTALESAARAFLRTTRHPAVAGLPGRPESFDDLYESAPGYDDLYAEMAERLVEAAVEAAAGGGFVAYAVPGSPYVAERSVAALRADGRVEVEIVAAPSFLDLAWDRLGVDPLVASVRLVDAHAFATDAAGQRGPLLVGHCHSRAVLSEVKLAVEDPGETTVTVLHHLGLPDEEIREVPWDDLDRIVEPDHLTSLWIPVLASPVAADLVRLEELVRVLRARCPWDSTQTHGSLARHLLEESYEALDAIETLSAAEPDPPAAAVAHLEEELGDLLFQVVIHSVLAAEEGRFTLADVARVVHDKLVARHPHVFGDVEAHTPEQVAERWEQLKKTEKGRASVTEGIPDALPALALAAKLQRKAESVSMSRSDVAERRRRLEEGVRRLDALPEDRSGETLDASAGEIEAVGQLLFDVADVARRAGIDPETALRGHALRFRRALEDAERTG